MFQEVTLIFKKLRILSSNNCRNDRLEVWHTLNDTGEEELIDTFCKWYSNQHLPSPIKTFSSKVKLKFKTNKVGRRQGFKIKFQLNGK